jgi:hypothetical protein
MVVISERLCEKASEIERRKELAVWPGMRRTHRRRDTVGAHQLHAHGDGVDAALVRSVGVRKDQSWPPTPKVRERRKRPRCRLSQPGDLEDVRSLLRLRKEYRLSIQSLYSIFRN